MRHSGKRINDRGNYVIIYTFQNMQLNEYKQARRLFAYFANEPASLDGE